MLKTTGYAIGFFVVAIAMMSWFASEAVKPKKEAAKYYTSMALMIVSVVGGLWFGAQTLKAIRNGVSSNVNMPSNAAGAANVPAPGAPLPSNAAPTNASANKVV